MPKNRPNCPHPPPAGNAGEPLFTWIVWHDRAPLNSPLELGRVQAPTKPVAESEAAKKWPGLALLVQSAASAKIRRVDALPLPHELAPKKRSARRRAGHKGQYDAFCAEKRRAHDAATRGRAP